MKKIIFTFLLLFPSFSFAAPSVTSITGAVEHGQSIEIKGADFGTKSPAKPLYFNDFENDTVNTVPSTTIANDFSQVPLAEVQVGTSRGGESVPEAYQTKIRAVNYNPTGTAIAGPHSHSTKYVAGGHYEDDVDLCVGGRIQQGRSISLTVAPVTGTSTHWYMYWLYRLSEEWPTCGNSPNHKYMVLNENTTEYSGAWFFMNYNNSDCPCTDDELLRMRAGYITGDVPGCTDLDGDGTNDTDIVANPKKEWVAMEVVAINDDPGGTFKSYANNVLGWKCDSNTDWFTDKGAVGIGSTTIGGYYREGLCGENVAEQNNNAFRFFDDVYIDNTLSRVMITNNIDYASATIIVPQPSTVWSDTSITIILNEGGLNFGEEVYIFVFDADGNYNSSGYPLQAAFSNINNIGSGASNFNNIGSGSSTITIY